MKNQKGVTLKTLIIIVAVVIGVISITIINNKNQNLNFRKEKINDYNKTIADYNLAIVKKNTIIAKTAPNTPHDMYFKEAESIPLDMAKSDNFNNMLNLYYNEFDAVKEYNNKLLEVYKVLLNENE